MKLKIKIISSVCNDEIYLFWRICEARFPDCAIRRHHEKRAHAEEISRNPSLLPRSHTRSNKFPGSVNVKSALPVGSQLGKLVWYCFMVCTYLCICNIACVDNACDYKISFTWFWEKICLHLLRSRRMSMNGVTKLMLTKKMRWLINHESKWLYQLNLSRASYFHVGFLSPFALYLHYM